MSRTMTKLYTTHRCSELLANHKSLRYEEVWYRPGVKTWDFGGTDYNEVGEHFRSTLARNFRYCPYCGKKLNLPNSEEGDKNGDTTSS